jgi:outer membrane lipoprotein-sorting protein
MRKIAGIVVGVVGVFAIIIFSVRGGEDAKVREVVDRAIKAHGGADNLEKLKASTFKVKGKLLDLDYTAENIIQLPNQIRTTAESKLGKYVQIFNGEKGWVKFADLTRECVKEELPEYKEQLNALQISHLTVLSDKDYKLSPLGEEKIDDRTVIGVRVEHQSFRDVNLYFDKENGLLLKMQTRIKDPLRGGEEFASDTLYSDYKEVDGIMTYHKFTIMYDGKVYNEGEVIEVKHSEKLDDSMFANP